MSVADPRPAQTLRAVVAEEIRAVMARRQITQRQLATETSLSQSAISRIVRAETPPSATFAPFRSCSVTPNPRRPPGTPPSRMVRWRRRSRRRGLLPRDVSRCAVVALPFVIMEKPGRPDLRLVVDCEPEPEPELDQPSSDAVVRIRPR